MQLNETINASFVMNELFPTTDSDTIKLHT